MSFFARGPCRLSPSLCLLATVAVLALCRPSLVLCDQFDWRDYPGSANLPAGNYITPVRNQGSVGTCWAFCACAAVEANYDITYHVLNSTLDLSEQNLVCAGQSANWFGNIFSGWNDLATQYIMNSGITTENVIPYNQTNHSPYYPPKPPYTLYKITDMWFNTQLNADPASIKSYLETYGPVEVVIYAETDFITPTGAPYPVASSLVADVSSLPELIGASGVTLDHAVLITGFTDDPSIPGGGYWHIKNSWGDTWGPTGDGYGYVSYSTMETDDYLTVIDGTSYTVTVPEPATLFLLCMGGLALRMRRK